MNSKKKKSNLIIYYRVDAPTKKIVFDWPEDLPEKLQEQLPESLELTIPLKPEFGNANHIKQFDNLYTQLDQLRVLISSHTYSACTFMETSHFTPALDKDAQTFFL